MSFVITDIRQCWEAIQPGLRVIAAKCAAEWRLEDVYAKCLAGDWTVFLDPEVEGFFILSQYTDRYRLEKRLVVECAYYAGDEDAVGRYEPWLLETASSIGAVCVEFTSPRLGWQRKGWAVTDVTYRKEV